MIHGPLRATRFPTNGLALPKAHAWRRAAGGGGGGSPGGAEESTRSHWPIAALGAAIARAGEGEPAAKDEARASSRRIEVASKGCRKADTAACLVSGRRHCSHHRRLLQLEMSKRKCSAGPEARTTIVDSATVELKVDYEQTMHLAKGEAVHSNIFSAGGHMWRISCYPRGTHLPRHLCIMVEHLSKSRCAKAIIEGFLMDKHGNPSLMVGKRSWTCFLELMNLTSGLGLCQGPMW
ncbi:hypothetical protein EJB05_48154, partial [Eragrostis curvula]